jgi:hypothetical protein
MSSGTGLIRYEAARAALAVACRVDEVVKVRDQAQRLRLDARQAKDRGMIADAAELRMRAECRLGQLLAAAKAAGQLARGRPETPKAEPKSRPAKKGRTGSQTEKNGRDGRPFPRVILEAAGISKDLSASAQKLAGLPERTFTAVLAETREKIAAGDARVLNPQSVVLVNARKIERRAEVVALAHNPMLLPGGPFAGVVVDPPWDDPDHPIGFNTRHHGFHYPLLAPAAIADLPVAGIFGPRAILALWIMRRLNPCRGRTRRTPCSLS